MKRKLFFRHKPLKNIDLKDELSKPTPLNLLINVNSERDVKPIQKKVLKREIISGVVQFEKWNPIVQRWALKYHLSENIISEFEIHSDRIDIVTLNYRISITASVGSEFNVSLYCDYKCIEVRYISLHELESALNYVYQGKGLFNK